MTEELICRKSGVLDDWYVIERVEAPGTHEEWMEPEDGGYSFQHSARISDADVEGDLSEMKALAVAIRARGNESFKRCAVYVHQDRAEFWSPRNSQQSSWVSLAVADALATQIEALEGEKNG